MFNFLERTRLVIALKRKRGAVQEISFSAWQPDEVRRLVLEGGRDRAAS